MCPPKEEELTHRFIERRYFDTDVLALYMMYREARIGPFVREVEDYDVPVLDRLPVRPETNSRHHK